MKVWRVLVKSISDGNVTSKANAIAYNLFLSIFPAIIFLFALIPYLHIPDLDKQVLNLMKELMPDYSYKTFEALILDIVKKQRGGLLSFSALTTIYFATNGINSFLSAFQNSIFFDKKENWIKKRINSLLLGIIIIVLMSVATLLMIFSNFVVNMLIDYGILSDNYVVFLIMAGKWLTIFLVFYFSLNFLYYFGTPKGVRKWKWFSIGTIFSTVMIVLVSWGFSFYVSNFGHYNKFYGSLGAIIVMLIWLYMISLTILLGFEINESIDVAKS